MYLMQPTWLWLLALPALLLLIHALRAGARRRAVSSLLLWRGVPRRALPARRLRTPPLHAALVLALGALGLLALAAADPWAGGVRPPRAVAVVVDPPAGAGTEARDAALAILRDAAAAPLRLLAIAGDEPLFVSAGPGGVAPFESALEDLERLVPRGRPLAGPVRAAARTVSLAGGGVVAVVADFASPGSDLPAPERDVSIRAVVTTPAAGADPRERPLADLRLDAADPDRLGSELYTALEALADRPRPAKPHGPAIDVLQGQALPAALPPRWVFFAEAPPEAAASSHATAPSVLDLLGPAADALGRFHPIVLHAPVGTVVDPPAGAEPLALAGGRVALARVEREGSRGIWCGVPLGRTDLAARAVLPLALDALFAQALGEPVAGGPARRPPAPPPGAVPAATLLARSAGEPWRMRPWLAALAVVVLLAEAVRRVVAPRRVAQDDDGARAEPGGAALSPAAGGR